MSAVVAEVRDLRVTYPAGRTARPILDGVSFALREGECVALVGESGAGKSTVALALLGLLAWKSARAEGAVRWRGRPVDGKAWERLRGRAIGYVPQEPQAALNPYVRCGEHVRETLRLPRQVAADRVAELLRRVGLDPAVGSSFPHQVSGGMAQRLLLAAALANDPDLLLLDEPTAAVDQTTQARMLALVRQHVTQGNASALIITHDLSTAVGTCQRILVLHAGRLVEDAPTEELLRRPRHPYAAAWVAATEALARGA